MRQDQQETIRSYDTYASLFEEKFRQHFDAFVRPLADVFLKALPGKRIWDIGCGAGDHAVYFATHGMDVTCGDLSPTMVERCRAKGLDAQVMDLEALSLPHASVDGIWMYASLLHVPRKKAPEVIARVADALVPDGIFGLAVKEGEGERYEEGEKYKGTQRYFVFYSDEDVRTLIASRFEVLEASRTVVKNGKAIFLNYLLRKRA
jgi:SAM-dependent methyltransferase